MSYRPPPQERGIPVVSSAAVQPPLGNSVFPGSYPPAPQLASRYGPSFAGNYVNPAVPFQEEFRRPVASPSSYPRLPQRLHHPLLNTQQAIMTQRPQAELQLNLQDPLVQSMMPNDLPSAYVRHLSAPVIGQPQPVVPTLHTPMGFTPEQLTVLRQQILVFRRMKKQDYAIDQESLMLTKPVPLHNVPEKAEDGIAAKSTPKNAPLFRLDHVNDSSLSLRVNAAVLLRREYSERITQSRKEEIIKLERALRGPTMPGFPPIGKKRTSGIPYRGELMTRLRKLTLLGLQKKMRREVEEHQIEIMKLSDRAYRRFVRDCNRTRFEMFKAGEKAKSDRAQERAQAAKRAKVPPRTADMDKTNNDDDDACLDGVV